ncbi:MAG: chlorophyll synthesis pathway protein BchC [Pseudomonadota bacterium]
MRANAVVLRQPRDLGLELVTLDAPGPEDVVVRVRASGVSTGTERLLWTGEMPDFPGMGYPLVPGYEAVGEIVEAGARSGRRVGERVFVPGARCFGEVRGLFGAAADTLVCAGARVVPVDAALGDAGALIALAATARRAWPEDATAAATPALIVGHGVLGRLLARIAVALGAPAPMVWEIAPERRSGAEGYELRAPEDDPRRDYAHVIDVSGAADQLDRLIARLAPGGEVTLAGFYSAPLSFAFPPAFMKEARMRVAAAWKPDDLADTRRLIETGALSMGGLITHRAPAAQAADAYRTAFEDSRCLKMILNWSDAA